MSILRNITRDERSFDSVYTENCHCEDSRAFSLAALVNFGLLSLIIITAENRDLCNFRINGEIHPRVVQQGV